MALILLLTPGCKSGFTPLTADDNAKMAASCLATETVRFQWNWCNTNVVTGSNFREVCYGEIINADMKYPAILLKSREFPNGLCLTATGTWSAGSMTPDCEQVITRSYSYVAGRPGANNMTECLNVGQVVRISGALEDPRTEFVAHRP